MRSIVLLLHNARGHSDALKARRGGSKRTRAQKKNSIEKEREKPQMSIELERVESFLAGCHAPIGLDDRIRSLNCGSCMYCMHLEIHRNPGLYSQGCRAGWSCQTFWSELPQARTRCNLRPLTIVSLKSSQDWGTANFPPNRACIIFFLLCLPFF